MDDNGLREMVAVLEEMGVNFSGLGAGVPGVEPWDAEALDLWASKRPALSPGGQAARFLLWVWDRERAWRTSGGFDLYRALSAWTHEDRLVFFEWASYPFWPDTGWLDGAPVLEEDEERRPALRVLRGDPDE